jgi:hypothetical protein
VLARIGDNGFGLTSNQFLAPHAIAIDSRYDIYVGELAAMGWKAFSPDKPAPTPMPSLRKLVRVPTGE